MQVIVLLGLAFFLLKGLLSAAAYQPYAPLPQPAPDHGFLAISYFGVDRKGTESLIGARQLESHIKALRDSGYVTIRQQDVLAYYREGKPLPEKALLLLFEDGRRDTAIFAQKIMEEYNAVATMFSYADKFEKKDPKFLSPQDIKSMLDSSYWETGTNGYRLAFINVFDRYGYYLGELNSLEFSMMAPYLARKYDHYLMDYLRDEYGVPKESFEEMKARIHKDYQLMANIYQKELGELPAFYALMHSNTGQFGSNEKVSRVNAEHIHDLFAININREGHSHNDRGNSLYDLTRIQPQAHWSANHLLMRIWDDTRQDMAFVLGNEQQAALWSTVEGVAEFSSDSIILTSLPAEAGRLRLKSSEEFGDISLSCQLEGNALGSQAVLLRADKGLNNYLRVALEDKHLVITQVEKGKEQELFSQALDSIAGISPISVTEDKNPIELGRMRMTMKYATQAGAAMDTFRELSAAKKRQVPSVAEGAEEYIPNLDLNESQEKQLSITLEGERLTVAVDGIVAAELPVQGAASGALALEARSSFQKYSQRNLTDDVYDGVFRNIMITGQGGEVLFDGRPQKAERILAAIAGRWHDLIDWFVKVL